MSYTHALIAFVALLVLAFPYVQRAKHPAQRTLAGYLLFLSVFSLAAGVLYFVLGALAAATGFGETLAHPVVGALFLALIFVPAFLVARWQLKRPPRQVTPP